MKQYGLRLLASILLISFFLAGCSVVKIPRPVPPAGDETGEVTPPPEDNTPVSGGTLRLAIPNPDTLNPLLTNSRDIMNFFGIIYESVVKYDTKLKPQPSLASGWEVLDNGTLWVFYIRKDIKWHNGKKLTAEDVLFTFEALRSGRLNSYYDKHIAGNDNIVDAGLKDGDPYIFYIQLNSPSALIPDIMTFPVVSQEFYKNIDTMLDMKEDLTYTPIGSGPFKVSRNNISEGREIKLEKNTRWWKGKAYIDAITAKIYRNNETARAALVDNKVDVVDTMAFYANAISESNDIILHRYSTHNYEFLALNPDKPLFKDKNIRKAIALAINRKEIISRVYLNSAEAVDVPVLLRSWLYDSKYRVYDYDIDRARSLLKESGWEDTDEDGYLDKNDGKTVLSFTLLTNDDNDLRRESIFLISKQLAEIGIKVNVRSVSWEELWGSPQEDANTDDDNEDSLIKKGSYDALLTGYYLDYAHDLSFAFHSREIDNGINNFIRYNNKEMDNLLDNAYHAYDDAKRVQYYSDIQKHITERLPVISLYFRTGSLMTGKKVRGVKAPWDMGIYHNIEEWYIEK